jgi:hypothetical protein
MHRDMRAPGPGKCPRCGMNLLPAGTRFALLRHIAGNPRMLVFMVAVMIAVMAAIMMLR